MTLAFLFLRVDTIPACDRRVADGRTDTLISQRPAGIASRG